jgi:integrase/recombinase XerD
MRAVIATARDAGLYESLLVRLLYEVALRAGEVGALRLDHLKRLDQEQPQLYLPRFKGSTSGWLGISDALASMLRTWVQEHFGADAVTLARAQPGLFVFPGSPYKGKARGITRQTVYNVVKRLCKSADVDPTVAHPHALRHARATHLFQEAEEQGLDSRAALQTVAKLLGHKTAETSWEHYIAETGRGREVADAAFRRATEDTE